MTNNKFQIISKSKFSKPKTVWSLLFRIWSLFVFCLLFFGISAASASAASNVFYSVGQTTDDLMTGTPTVSLSSGTATFSVAQTGNIGVGDVIDYDTDNKKCYISGKSTTSVWTCTTATGATPGDVTDKTVNSIKRAYTSLSSAEAGASDSNHLNNTDLTGTGADVILHFPCYYDTGADTTAVTISGWTTGASNYIKVYTPNNTSTECNISQRHSGKWDEGKYRLSVDGSFALSLQEAFTRIDGLQIDNIATGIAGRGLTVGMDTVQTVTDIRISNGIFTKTVHTSSVNREDGIESNTDTNVTNGVIKLWNNIFYDFNNGNSSSAGLYTGEIDYTWYLYNNIFQNNTKGIYRTSGTIVLKNNITQNCTDNFNGTFDSSSTTNITDLSPEDGAWGTAADSGTTTSASTKKLIQTSQNFTSTVKVGMIVKNTTDTTYSHVISVDSDTQLTLSEDIMASGEAFTIYTNRYATVRFADAENDDFHLHFLDTAAKDTGVDLSGDTYLPFSTDIDGHTRATMSTWDIGADEATTAIYRSVGPSASSALASGTTNAMTISGSTATFTSPLDNVIGVGDALQYDSDNDGSNTIDSIAFIYERLDSTHYIIKKADGTAPTATTASVGETNWDIFRAYTSLQNGDNATENTSLNDTVENFDTWSGGKDLVTNNMQWNFACYANGTTADGRDYISGWETGPLNYIRIYTPTDKSEVGTSQRHQGKWDDNKYKIEYSGDQAIEPIEDYVRLEGLQLYSDTDSVFSSFTTDTAVFYLSNNIFKTITSRTTGSVVYLGNFVPHSKIYIYNNVFVDGTGSGMNALNINDSDLTAYVYNNTIEGATGINVGAYKQEYIKNNLIYASNAFSGSPVDDDTYNDYNSISENNASEVAIGSHGKYNQTFSFVDSVNNDFHLTSADVGAKNFGTDLSSDSWITAGMGMTKDIDGQGRPTGASTWDIGADERNVNVYYSVSGGGDTTTDRKVASTVTISGGVATFSAAQTGNIGVGDVIDYDTDNKKAYISGKIDQSNWYVTTATGDNPSTGSGLAVNSIKRVWGSLSSAEAGASGSSYINNTDLVSAGVTLNIPCFYDTGADTTAVTIDGWTTGADNYIKVYTPNNTSTEANVSQRHSGRWDEGKWRLEKMGYSSYLQLLQNYNDYTKIEGLQIKGGTSYTNGQNRLVRNDNPEFQLSNSIITGIGSTEIYGIHTMGAAKIWNNIVMDCASDGIVGDGGTSYFYNNTIHNSGRGIWRWAGTIIAKNNVVQNCTDGFYGTFESSSDYNISDISGDTTGGAHDQAGVSVKFVDENNDDFHLAGDDTVARDQAADLSADSYLAFSSDVDGDTRPTGSSWDIGADEGAVQIFRSNGPSATGALDTGAADSNELTISSGAASFSIAVPDNVGVGDAIQYDSDNDDTLDAIMFISKRTDSQHYSVQASTGAAPSDMATADTDWSIYRAYTSLYNAERGNENDSLENTLEDFDNWDGTGDYTDTDEVGRDIAANNQQWNIACYANGTTADSTGVTISGWTTAQPNYLKIYTPVGTSEVGTSQRHQGKWDTSKYRLEMTLDWNAIITVNDNFVKIDGLQVTNNSASNNDGVEYDGMGEFQISNNIIKGTRVAVDLDTSYNSMLKVWNNFIYDFASNGIRSYHSSDITRVVAYNNTLHTDIGTTAIGIYIQNANAAYVKNNIVQKGTTTMGSNYSLISNGSQSSSNNISEDGTSPDSNFINLIVQFADENGDDFHLSINDTAALNAGANLVEDAYFAFQDDIDGDPRDMYWSIGADEGGKAIVQSGETGGSGGNVNTNVSLNDGLVGYWSFNGPDVSGTTAFDRSGNNNNGTITGATPALGKRGQGMDFVGLDDYINCGSDNSLDDLHNSGGLTISAWINPRTDGEADMGYIMTKDTNFAGGWFFSMYGWRLQFWKDGSTELHVRSNSGSVLANQWQHAVVTWDGSTTASNVHLFINGEETGYELQIDGESFFSDASLSAYIGARSAGMFAFDGKIDEVRVYNRALSAEEVGQLYRFGGMTIDENVGSARIGN